MQLKQLFYLKAVAETQSIRKASSKLFVSQQAISQSLKNLEEEYHVQLLERNVYGVTLTEAGEYAVVMAKKILDLQDELEQYFWQQENVLREGTLCIAAIPSFKKYILPEAEIKFMQRYPKVKFSAQLMGPERVITMMREKQAEIGFLGMMFVNDESTFTLPESLHFYQLFRYEYCVIIGANSPLNKYQMLSIKSILRYPIIFLKEQLQGELEDYLPYRILSQFGEVQALIADSAKLFGSMIAANMGVGIAGDGIFLEDYPKTVTKPLRENIYGHFGYIVNEKSEDNILVKDFLDILHHTISVE